MQQTAWEKRLTNWVVKRIYVEGDLLRKVFQPLAGMRKGYDCCRIILKQLITHFWKRVVLATLLCIESCATALMHLYAFDVFSWLDFSGIHCQNAKALILHHKTDTKLLNCTRMTSAPGLERIKAQAAVLSSFLGLQQNVGTKVPWYLPMSWTSLSLTGNGWWNKSLKSVSLSI